MDQRIEIVKGDITLQQLDVIVNAANSSLLGGGGVDGAIHWAGGSEILEECLKIRERQGGCPTGEAVITTAGKLPAAYVIHTVGPVWKGGNNREAELLANCYRNALQLAVDRGLKTIAFPNISTGVYGYPKPAAAEIALQTTVAFLATNASLEKVIFVCFDEANFRLYETEINKM